MPDLYPLLRSAVFKIDPETAHNMTLKAMKAGLVRSCKKVRSDTLKQELFGLTFENPIGMAAGFDKNAEVIDPVLGLGFGFTEVGTVTPKPQYGNPKPRIFRDPPQQAVINRLGFPNAGLTAFKRNLERAKRKGIVGVNIGMNKDQNNPAADYCLLIQELAPLADYFTVNISSPNTPGLRNLQEKEPLIELLGRLMEVKDDTPLLVKLAPDLTDEQQEEIAGVLVDSGVSGVILTNTTLERPDYLSDGFRDEKGGLSGAPLRDQSTAIIRNFYTFTGGKLPIIGVGGVFNAADAYEKIKAGASLVQLYTGMIYEGPEVANRINMGLVEMLEQDGFARVGEAVGRG